MTQLQIGSGEREGAQALLDFIDASPSPWHAAAQLAERLRAHGFTELDEANRWYLKPGDRRYVLRGGSSLVAFIVGETPIDHSGYRIIGAHTDSPGFRIKPHPVDRAGGMNRLGVEVYGGPILATFTDRDLSLAGRVCLRTASGLESRLIRFDQPLIRLPNLAIHMNRKVNDEGLKLNRQTELPLLLCAVKEGLSPDILRDLLGRTLDCPVNDILAYELNVYDTQPGAFWGPDAEFISDGQLDNLASCDAALNALISTGAGPRATCVTAFFDHEEIGSESAKGAAGSLLADVVERLSSVSGLDREGLRCALARSLMVSADMAHAYQPNFPWAYEPNHQVLVNAGPVIKINANQRYATDSLAEARFANLCEREQIPYQKYCHRTDLACGTTIGPLAASRLGIDVVDVGSPMWAMHSARESAGVLDHRFFTRALAAFFAD